MLLWCHPAGIHLSNSDRVFFYCIFQWQLALQPSKKLVILYSLWVLAVMIWLCLSAMWMEIKLSWISMMFQPLEVLYVVLLQNDTVLWHSFVAQFCQLFVLFCFTIMICFILHFSMYLAPFDKLFIISEHIKCQVWWHNSYKWCRYTLFRTKFQVCK